ncbi:MAG: hypothetical protein C0599_16860 [Salinivirgaceae bacterium]|nr:MAG: hypothetical protein C0599_16860 [Salinivirgaceae bacterium]
MFLTLAFFSCKDDESILGENFLDGKLDLYFDTVFNVTTLSTAYEDTTTVKSGASVSLIGDYHDPIFGDHKSITAFNLVPQGNTVDSGSYVPLSVKMKMEYRGTYYGYDTVNPITFSIHRVTDTLTLIDG